MGIVLLSMAATACGAKSGLDVAPPVVVEGEDAGGPDGGFDTFPCRWSMTSPVEVVRRRRIQALVGAVHGAADEVLVLGRGESGTWFGGRFAVGDPPRMLAYVERGESGELMGWRGGYGELASRCDQRVYDGELGLLSERRIDVADNCVLEPAVGTFDVTAFGSGEVAFVRATPDGVGTPIRTVLARVSTEAARVVDAPPFVTFTGGGLEALVAHHPLGGTLMVSEVGGVGAFDVGRDFVRPGAVVLYENPDGFYLDRIDTSTDALGARNVADPTKLEATPFGTLAVNETEALVPLRDGRVAAQPLSGTPTRFVGPVHEAPRLMRVFLRPGTSTGGVAYVHRFDREDVLSFRTLVCNR